METEAERGKKGNLYEVQSIEDVTGDVRIATLSNIFSREEHFAVQASFSGVVYFRTNDAEKAVSLAMRLARTFKGAARCGARQEADYWQPFCEAGPVHSYGAGCAAAIAQAMSIAA